MKAFVLERYGKGEAMRLADLPEPIPGPGEVLIEVHAAGVNPLDSKIRDGAFKMLLPYKPPFVLGHDVAGRVVRIGQGVHRFAVGDEVYARPRDGHIGSLAEFIAVPETDVARKPRNITMEEAASLPLTALTAWQVLVERGHVAPGHKVLIHAGSGGVGVMAIQIAKHCGATVATTAGSAGADLVRSLGADTVIDYRSQNFASILSDQHLVLASQDAETLSRSVDVLRPGVLAISLSGPPDPDFARALGLNWLMRGVINLLSLRIRRKAKARGVDYQFLFMRADGEQLGEITKLVETGAIRPVLDRVFPSAEVNEALAYVDRGRAKGKVVVTLARKG
jgi:NADPH:quinone reductase-like Zn-dependent oxidoreductase